MPDELLDIVNEKDEVIGQELRSSIYNKGASNFRVVNAFIQNGDGRLWIPRRSSNKRIFPSCLDASMGGHVEAGETYEQALSRELMEELHIDLSQCDCKEIGRLTPYQHNVSAFMKVFLIHSDTDPMYNQDDFVGFYWLFPFELLGAIAAGEASKTDLPLIVKQLF